MFTNRENHGPFSSCLGLRSKPNKKIQFAKLLCDDGTVRNIICFEEHETKHDELSELNLLGIEVDDFFTKMDKINDASISGAKQFLEKIDKNNPFNALLQGFAETLFDQLQNKQREA